MPSLARISVTPMKGTAIHHPDRVELTERGVAQDRRFYLVDDSGALFSGPEHPLLVRIRAEHDAARDHLALTMPDGDVVEGPAAALGGREVTDFYGRPVPAHEVEGPFSRALTSYCGRPVRVLRPDREGDAADVEPVTVVSFASVRDLGQRGGHDGELDGRRFRMNLELDGCTPYEEDAWSERLVRVGEATIRIGEQVPRCVFTTKDPDTGDRDWDTLTQIAKFRPRIADGGGLPFGMYARVVQPATVAVGDVVEPLDA